MAQSSVNLKLLIDTQTKRVLFAEAGKDYVDFLFHILSVPVGTVMSILKKHENVGSLANLYRSVENLDESYVQPKQSKGALLKPMTPISSPGVPLLDLKDASTAMKLYKCTHCSNYVTQDQNAECPGCKRKMTQSMTNVVVPPITSGDGGFVKGVVTYMVMDDLVVTPLSSISSITLLHKFQVKDLGVLEEKVVNFGRDEV